ncbi:outer membrane protein [Tardiphaga sp. 804_B3_N1_9]|uniref:outer membrane protein n=1 Tax=Tardiphaga TaxID=1395974 RepID=UPI001586271C|nr:outer membrane beta-barrel protein [Tardiphaga robiniae]NUU42443.1 porin family protein [Tardiphaga robiniae]
MRSVKFILAAGAASLMSTAVLAADMPIAPSPQMYAPPPVEDFGGWYLRGDIGFSNQRVKNIEMGDGRNANLLSLQQTTAFDTAGIFQLGVGYQFNNWFRGDITGQYRGNSNFKGTDHVTFPSSGLVGTGVNNYNATKSEWVVMANGYVDLGTWWCVTPFVGAGVGMARVNIGNYTDNGAINVGSAGGVPFIGGPFPSYASAPAASKWNFAWALHTGLAYKVNPAMTVELGYSYMNLGDGQTGPVSTYDGFTRGVAMQFKDITSHDLKLGVRWNLDSPPAYAPPPLIRKG